MKSIFISPIRFYLVFVSIIFAFTFIGVRLYFLQVLKSEKYTEFAQGARKNFISVESRRGDIVDKKGNLLATTRSVVTVGMDPYTIDEEEDWKYPDLAKLLDIPVEKINRAASSQNKNK